MSTASNDYLLNSAVNALGSFDIDESDEDEFDLEAWHEAKAEFDADPVTISSGDIAKKFL